MPLLRKITAWILALFIPRNSVWVILHDGQRLLLGKRGRRSRRPGTWNFIGGRIEFWEAPLSAARRELREESGLAVSDDDLQFLGRIGGFHYYSHRLDSATALPAPNREISRFRWFAPTELPRKLHPKTAVFIEKNYTRPISTLPVFYSRPNSKRK